MPSKSSNVIELSSFLGNSNHAAKHKGKGKKSAVQNLYDYESLKASYLADAEQMKPGQLSAKYKPTYSSWRNMKQRVKVGAVIHPDFLLFASFLKIVGPRPSKAHTLDRIDNSDPEYAPGKVKWRDKFAQANNKSTNVTLTDNNGVTKTIAQWAHFKKVSPSTISKRLAKGWDAHSAIHGKPLAKSKVDAWSDTPWPLGREAWLEENYANRSEAESKMSRESWFVAAQEFNVGLAQRAVEKAAYRERDLSTGDDGLRNLGDEYALALKMLEHAEKQLARQQVAYESAKAHLQWAKARSAARAKGAVALQKFLAKHPRPDRIALPVVPD